MSRWWDLVKVVSRGSKGARAYIVAVVFGSPLLYMVIMFIIRSLRPKRNKLTFVQTPRNKLIVKKCPSFETYHAPSMVPTGHLHTIYGSLVRSSPSSKDIHYERHLLKTKNGAEVALDWNGTPRRGVPTLVLLHGLTGGSHENYIQWMIVSANKRGLQCVVMNARGCAESKLKTTMGFSACMTIDIRATAKHVRNVVGPGVPMYAVGYSLGACILSTYLHEEGDKSPFDAAALMAASYDMIKTSKVMEDWLHMPLYNRKLTYNLKRWLHGHEEDLKDAKWLDWKKVDSARSVREFDQAVIVPMYGYEDVWDYYRHASSGRNIEHIGVPTVVINALDDPICSADGLPYEEVMRNPNVIMIASEEGGHVAWMDGPITPKSTSWGDHAALDFFDAATKTMPMGHTPKAGIGTRFWDEAKGIREEPITPKSSAAAALGDVVVTIDDSGAKREAPGGLESKPSARLLSP